MEFIQKTVFSNDSFSKDLLEVLSAVGKASVTVALEKAKERRRLEQLVLRVAQNEFIDVSDLKDYKNDNKMSFMPMDKALRILPHFEESSTFYASKAVAHKKFRMLLESMNFMEADMLLRLVSKRFDTESVIEVLAPETVKPKRTKKQKNEEVEAESENLNEINELPDTDENVTD